MTYFPKSGRIVPELGDGKTREVIVTNYRVMYEVESDAVIILTVLHGARELPVRNQQGEPTLEGTRKQALPGDR